MKNPHPQQPRPSLFIILNSLFIIFLASCTPPPVSDILPTRMKTAVFPTLIPAATVASTVPPPARTPIPSPPPSPTRCLAGRMITGVYPSAAAGESRFRIYLPPCYDDGRLYPTLYLLPGNVHDDSIWDEMGLDEAAERGIVDGLLPPMLIVMVGGGGMANSTSGGAGSYEFVILDDLIPFIEGSYAADPANRAIGGLSRGGYWALEIAFRHPDAFVSVGGHSAALVDCCATDDVNPLYTGVHNDLTDLRIYLDTGRDDYLRANVTLLHEEMAAAGRDHRWVLNDGAHEEAYWMAHLDAYLAWYAEGMDADLGD